MANKVIELPPATASTAFVAPDDFFNGLSTEFDGSNEYVSIANPSNFEFNDGGGNDLSFTLSGWIKMVDATSFRLFDKRQNITNRDYAFNTGGSDQLGVFLYTTTGGNRIESLVDTPVTTEEDTWTHVACTYNGSKLASGLVVYINGAVPPQTKSTVGTYTGMTNVGGNLLIGRSSIAPDYADGRIDETSVWNVKLTAGEVTELYNLGVPSNLLTHSAAAGLISWWRMGDDDVFPTISDQKGSNDGTMTNMEAGDFKSDVP